MSNPPTTIEEKHRALVGFLEGQYAMVHFATSHPDVLIPEHLRTNESLTLKFSKLFLGKMTLAHDRISQDLLFKGKYFTCSVPLAAVWGITSATNENVLWPEDSPNQLLKEIAKEPKPPPPNRPALKRIK